MRDHSSNIGNDDTRQPKLSRSVPQRGAPLWIWIYSTVAGSFAIRASLLDLESNDYRMYLSTWYDFFLHHGRWKGLGLFSVKFASYPPLYMYLVSLSTLMPIPKLYAIKMLSLIGDYLAAWFVWRLVDMEFPLTRRPWGALTTFLFVPTVVMNGSLWGQCDVMYVCGFLASLFYLLEKRSVAALVAFGFSCSLKPQAIFWCPLLAALFINRQLAWKWVWIPGAVYLGCGIPAMLAGRPILDTIGHWAKVDNVPGLTLGAPNWYQWVFEQAPAVFWGAGITLTLVATAFFVLWTLEGPRPGLNESQWIVSLALLSVLFPPFFLPGMHDRYFFAADVLSVIYAFYVPNGFRVMILIQFSSAFSYLSFLFGQEPVPKWFLPLPILLALGLIVKDLLFPARIGEPQHGSGT
jgi:Gpi18-like mannosyltransferase